MTALEYILDGLEAELALERELGVRTVELDRALLVAPGAIRFSTAPGAADSPRAAGAVGGAADSPRAAGAIGSDKSAESAPMPRNHARQPDALKPEPATTRAAEAPGGDKSAESAQAPRNHARQQDALKHEPATTGAAFDFIFLHHRALSADGLAMLAKIVAWMRRTDATAPLVTCGEMPGAKVYVVMGGLALRKWFPGVNASPGQWFKTQRGRDVLVTYSPDYLLRFSPGSAELDNAKRGMSSNLREVLRKVGGLQKL